MNKMMFFAANQKGYEVLKSVIHFNRDIVEVVISFEEKDMKEVFFDKIKKLCEDNFIAFYTWESIKKNLINLIENHDITEAIAIGWRFLIPLSINNYLDHGLIVFHDSLLPKYRGFAPTPTAIICGEKEVGITVLYANETMDAGDIIIQRKVAINSEMYIDEIIDIQSQLYCTAMIELITMLENNSVISSKQDNEKATYSIWRDIEDCRINWNLEAEEIYNLIRAVSFPYTGAYSFMNEKKVIIWRAQVEREVNFARRDFGKVWGFDENKNPIIVCGKGMIRLLHVTDENGNKIEFNNLRTRLE